MAAIRLGDGHNDRVNPPSARHRPQRRPALPVLLTALLVSALVLAGCGGEEAKAKPKAKPSDVAPTGNVEVPSGLTLTKPGEKLAFGEKAVVAYAANPKRGTVLSMTVTGGRQGRISDFAGYQLSAANKKSRPYYMRAAVTNVGTGDLSRLGVPLYGVDASNTLIPPATFNNTFVPCPSTPFPQGFTAKKSLVGCLVYLVPDGGTLTAVSYRPSQKYAGITWSGTIAPPAPDRAAVKKAAQKKAQQAKAQKKKAQN
jgi:hypothetical protein